MTQLKPSFSEAKILIQTALPLQFLARLLEDFASMGHDLCQNYQQIQLNPQEVVCVTKEFLSFSME